MILHRRQIWLVFRSFKELDGIHGDVTRWMASNYTL